MVKRYLTNVSALVASATMAMVVGCSKGDDATVVKDDMAAKRAPVAQQAKAMGDNAAASAKAQLNQAQAGMAAKSAPAAMTDAKILALKFHHDSWGGCQAMGPIVKQAAAAYTNKPVAFITFDFTSDATTMAAKAKAKQYGVAAIYAENEKKTAFVLLVDRASGKVLKKLTPADDVTAYRTAIDKALGESWFLISEQAVPPGPLATTACGPAAFSDAAAALINSEA